MPAGVSEGQVTDLIDFSPTALNFLHPESCEMGVLGNSLVQEGEGKAFLALRGPESREFVHY